MHSELFSILMIIIAQMLTVYSVLHLNLYSIPLIMISCFFMTIAIINNTFHSSTFVITIVGLQYGISLIMNYFVKNEIPKTMEFIGGLFVLLGVFITVYFDNGK
jgi:drug/metabolite transporter (DMT)-like permease